MSKNTNDYFLSIIGGIYKDPKECIFINDLYESQNRNIIELLLKLYVNQKHKYIHCIDSYLMRGKIDTCDVKPIEKIMFRILKTLLNNDIKFITSGSFIFTVEKGYDINSLQDLLFRKLDYYNFGVVDGDTNTRDSYIFKYRGKQDVEDDINDYKNYLIENHNNNMLDIFRIGYIKMPMTPNKFMGYRYTKD